MKRAWEVALVFCGAVIGAGFASGREILTYFSSFSAGGLWGTLTLFVVFTLSVGVILRYCFVHRVFGYSEFLDRLFSKRWSKMISIVMTFFLFSTFFVMASGCGALFQQEFGWHPIAGVLILIGLSFFVLLFDLDGLTRMNTILTPILLIGMIAVSLCQVTCAALPSFAALPVIRKLIWNPFSSALIYVGYNMLLSMVVLVPLAKKLQSKREAGYSALLCGSVLFVTTVVVYLAMYVTYVKVLPFEIPLLHLAADFGKGAEYLYCGVMLMAMLTSSVAAGYGVMEKLQAGQGIPPKVTLAVLCVASVPFALMGFSNLISSLYGAFGVIGLVVLTAITWRCLRKD